MASNKIIHVIAPTVRQAGGTGAVPVAKRKVAAYARVSTDEEEQLTSYQNQVDYYTRYIQSRPEWEFVGLYSDEGISGLNTKKRDGFNRMVDDAMHGRIDLILTKSISRFARNTVDSLTTIRKLKDAGVEVYFEKENIYTFDSKGELLITIMSSIAQEESRSISENIIWGKRNNMKRGKVSMAYGHFLGYEKGADGKPQIVEEQAEIVRRIFRMYLDGSTVREISRALTADAIPTPSGKNCNWSVSTIMSILRNEKYKGDALLQKVYTANFLEKTVKKNNGILPQYYVENSHPAIIDAETFDLVQAELARRGGGIRGRRTTSIFDHKVICGDCGHFYGPKLWYAHNSERVYVWRCTHKYDTTPGCETPVVREEKLQGAFLYALNQLLGSRAEYTAELEREIAIVLSQKENSLSRDDKAALQARMGQIRRYLEALGNQPGLVTELNDGAFSALAESITIHSGGDMTVRFKDGTEIAVPKNQ